jgi:hypothetical protein
VAGGTYIEEPLNVGEETFIDSVSPNGHWGVFFEDDGTTGYFYGLDMERSEQRILDALHIYNVDNVVDADKPSRVQIAWTADGLTSALYINRYVHAIFAFGERRAVCRTGFPPATGEFTDSHDWDERLLELLR